MPALPSQRLLKYGGLCVAGLIILLSLVVHGVVVTGAVLGLLVLVLALL